MRLVCEGENAEGDLEDRLKQMVGHMVRQVMERRGYVVGVQNTKIANGAPFSRAPSIVCPTTWFSMYSVVRTLALTGDKVGARLFADNPHPATKWSYWKSFRDGLENEKQACAEIAQNGYFIYEMPLLRASA